jgi:hypothetical protein
MPTAAACFYTSPSSKAHQKSGSFPPPALPSFNGRMTLSDSRQGRRLSATLRSLPSHRTGLPRLLACALLDQVLAAEAEGVPTPAHLRGLRFAVPYTVFQNDLSPAVADVFAAALARLSAAGATVVELPMAELRPSTRALR